MITISKQNDGVLFTFENSDKYLYGNGSILVPFNTLSIVADESDMITLRKAASNDIFLSARYDTDLGYRSKDDAIDDLKDMLFAETGGGGSESGITSGEVQTMIDESISGKADTTAVTQEVSSAVAPLFGAVEYDSQTQRINFKHDATGQTIAYVDASSFIKDGMVSNVEIINGNLVITFNSDAGKQPISIPLTDIFNPANYYTTAQTQSYVSGFTYDKATIDQKVAEGGTFDPDLYYDKTATNALLVAKADTATTYTKTEVDAAISGKVDTSAVTAVNDALTAHTANTTVHVTSAEKTAWNAKQDALYIYTENTNLGTAELHSNDSSIIFNAGGTSITTDNPMGVNTFNVAGTGVTINGENVATEPYVTSAISGKADTSAVTAAIDDAKAYYIDFTTLATVGIHDDDWDGIVAAIDDHRPIYAGYPRTDGGIIYYGVECMNKNVSNTQIVLTASDNSAHYFYTFTKNGSNDYSYTVSTKPYVPDITTAITSGSTDTEIPTAKAVYDATQSGGGGATYSAGTNISIANDTINCTLPISAGSGSHSVVFNDSSNIGGTYEKNGLSSLSYGSYSKAHGIFAFAGGRYVNANNYAEMSVGFFNQSNGSSSAQGNNSGNTLFSVGNGASASARHNAFEIRQNGDIYVNDGTNDVRLQDTILALGGLKLVKLTQAEYDALATKDANTLYIISNVVS